MNQRIDPFSLSRPRREAKTFTLRDGNHPGLETEISFRALDAVEHHLIEEQASDVHTKYCGPDAVPFFAPAGEVIRLSFNLIKTACAAFVQQVTPVYTVEEYLVLSAVMPQGWANLVMFLTDLNNSGPLGKVASVSDELIKPSSDSQ